MLDVSIRKRKNQLILESIRLRNLLMEQDDFDFKLYQEQDRIYKKWIFYDRFIKAMEEVED